MWCGQVDVSGFTMQREVIIDVSCYSYPSRHRAYLSDRFSNVPSAPTTADLEDELIYSAAMRTLFN